MRRPRRVSARSGTDQHAGIQQALRVERALRALECRGEQRRSLAVIPRAMIAPDRMVVRNAATGRGDGLRMAQQAGAAVTRLARFYGHLLSRDAMTREGQVPGSGMSHSVPV